MSRLKGSSACRRGRVFEPVGGVGVEHDEDLGEGGAHRRGQLDVVAGLDFELDAAVALPQVAGDDVDGLGDAGLDADADADLDAAARPSG
jgi:hypothetical protein